MEKTHFGKPIGVSSNDCDALRPVQLTLQRCILLDVEPEVILLTVKRSPRILPYVLTWENVRLYGKMF